MTTIAYHKGTLYADSRGYGGDKMPIGKKKKIHRVTGGIFAGTSTNVGASERVRDILEAEGVHVAMPSDLDVDAFFVKCKENAFRPEEQNVELWGYYGGPAWVRLDETDTHFIGSGAQYAYGAFMFADTVESAMRAACELDLWSAQPIISAHAYP